MSLDLGDFEKLKLQLTRMREAPALANEELKRCAEDVAEMARNMAPIDYGDLKGAIQIGRRGAQGAGGRFMKGVSTYEVFINDKHPVSDPEKLKHGVDYVGEYAWYVHEHMGWGAHDTGFMPSQYSVEEGARHGVDAGGKFLERAGEAMRAEIKLRLASVVFKYLESLDNLY